MPAWSAWRATVLGGAAVALTVAAFAAEAAGRQTQHVANLVAALALALGGVVVVGFGSPASAGALLVAAALSRFVATAHLVDGVQFVHRALLIHALVVVAVGDRGVQRRAWSRVGRWALLGLTYVIALDSDLAAATPWTLLVAAIAVGTVIVTALRGEAPLAPVLGASAGTMSWALAAGPASTGDWFSQSTLLRGYVSGIVVVVASVAAWAVSRRRAATVSSGDLVRDHGPRRVTVAFGDGNGEFEDLNGEPFVVAAGEAVLRLDLGGGLGEAIVTTGRAQWHTARRGGPALGPRSIDGLRLVAGNRDALRRLRRGAAEVAASARRVRDADELASAAISGELGRVVVPRIERALALLERDESAVASRALASLTDVLAEIRSLGAGLAPAHLGGGLRGALASLGDPGVVTTIDEIDDASLDAATGLTLYLVAAECVANALRHGAPSAVTIDLRDDDGTALLTVTDDGAGGAVVGPLGRGGLGGLESRLEAAGGLLDVGTRPGGGTVVTARLPLARNVSSCGPAG